MSSSKKKRPTFRSCCNYWTDFQRHKVKLVMPVLDQGDITACRSPNPNYLIPLVVTILIPRSGRQVRKLIRDHFDEICFDTILSSHFLRPFRYYVQHKKKKILSGSCDIHEITTTLQCINNLILFDFMCFVVLFTVCLNLLALHI